MHEASLVKSLLGQVDAIRVEQAGSDVDEVRVEIGPLSGVEPLLFETAFARLAPQFGMEGTRLVVDEVPLAARCRRCGPIEIRQFRFLCPSCGATEVQVVGGDEVRLSSVTIRHGSPSEAAT